MKTVDGISGEIRASRNSGLLLFQGERLGRAPLSRGEGRCHVGIRGTAGAKARRLGH